MAAKTREVHTLRSRLREKDARLQQLQHAADTAYLGK
jgi:hypothetical protein